MVYLNLHSTTRGLHHIEIRNSLVLTKSMPEGWTRIHRVSCCFMIALVALLAFTACNQKEEQSSPRIAEELLSEASKKIDRSKGKFASGYMGSVANGLFEVLSTKDVLALFVKWNKESNSLEEPDSVTASSLFSFSSLSPSALGVVPDPYLLPRFVHGVIHAKPPMYSGEREINFIATVEQPGTRAAGATSSYIYETWLNIYSPSSIEPHNIPKNAMTLAIGWLDGNGGLLAEAAVLSVDQDTFRVLEVHYKFEGGLKPIFTCESTFSLSNGFKLSESNVAGEKVKDFYFIWPIEKLPF